MQLFTKELVSNQWEAILDESNSNFKVFARIKPIETIKDKSKSVSFRCFKNNDTNIWVDTDIQSYSNFYSVST